MIKSTVEEKIKSSGLAIMVISALGALLSAAVGAADLMGLGKLEDDFSKKMMIKTAVSNFIGAVILAVAAVIFYRIFISGRPFTHGNIMAVRVIAVLFLLNSAVPSLVVGAALGFAKTSIIGAGALFNAVLFFFFAEIMRYGNLLQTESDETL